MASAKQKQLLEAGARAPDFRLPDVNGREVALRDLLANGPVVLAFFKTTCPVCQLTFPFLDRIHSGRTPASLSIYGISQDDAEDTRDFNRRYAAGLPTLLDSEESGYPVSNAFGISYVPSLFLVERDGTISRTVEGFSKKDLQSFGALAGTNPFRPGEYVPEQKSG